MFEMFLLDYIMERLERKKRITEEGESESGQNKRSQVLEVEQKRRKLGCLYTCRFIRNKGGTDVCREHTESARSSDTTCFFKGMSAKIF